MLYCVKVGITLDSDLLCWHWQDEWAVLRLVDTLDRFRKRPAMSTRMGRVWEKIKGELKKKHVPLPEDLQVRVPRGTPKEAARRMLCQMFAREEDRGDIPPPFSSGRGHGRGGEHRDERARDVIDHQLRHACVLGAGNHGCRGPGRGCAACCLFPLS